MSYLSDETGAVTVDWVVITASLVGLALAVMAVISDGIRSSSNDVDRSMRAIDVSFAFGDNRLEEVGLGSWIGGAVTTIAGLGDVVAASLSTGEAVVTLDPPGEQDFAVIEFDMMLGDSWDGEVGTITIDGVEALSVTHNHRGGEPTITYGAGGIGTTAVVTRVESDTGSWSGADNNDYVYRVRMTTENDGGGIRLGASSTLDQNVGDEFFGISDLSVVGRDEP